MKMCCENFLKNLSYKNESECKNYKRLFESLRKQLKKLYVSSLIL